MVSVTFPRYLILMPLWIYNTHSSWTLGIWANASTVPINPNNINWDCSYSRRWVGNGLTCGALLLWVCSHQWEKMCAPCSHVSVEGVRCSKSHQLMLMIYAINAHFWWAIHAKGWLVTKINKSCTTHQAWNLMQQQELCSIFHQLLLSFQLLTLRKRRKI